MHPLSKMIVTKGEKNRGLGTRENPKVQSNIRDAREAQVMREMSFCLQGTLTIYLARRSPSPFQAPNPQRQTVLN